ncbi:MAG: cellulose synthase complex periplasmic endoglucanase BcsZ [Myxococcales bacterium]|nr:cellulase [Myxococcales bacterium]
MTALLAAAVMTLGPTKAQRESAAAALDFPFVARADEELTNATVRLTFDAPLAEAVDVLVNDERVAHLEPREMAGSREVPVSRELLADRNQIGLRLRDAAQCASHAGAWRGLRSVAVAVEAAPVPLPDELALLPLPFYDKGYDASAVVPIVLAHAPSMDEVRLEAITAAWFAVDAPIPLAFEAYTGALADSRAIVLVGSADDAARLRLPPPEGPSVRLMNHPDHPGSNVKLLVIGGRDRDELQTAVEALAARGQRLGGPIVRLGKPSAQAAALPYSAPRWIPSDRALPFSGYPEEQVLSHDGIAPATLSVRFRVAPDLFVWPADFVRLDLQWTEDLHGAPPPRLDVEMNGHFLATLPRNERSGTERLRIPRQHLRGFNELLVHVRYPGEGPCAAPSSGPPPRVSIDGSLRVAGLPHFASLPDVSLFAFDGFPFTRVPDLGDTAVVLPEKPDARQLSTVLSVFGHFAQITGAIGRRAQFATAPVAGKDLLAVGPLPRGWGALSPIDAEGAVREREPLLDLLGGIGPLLDAHRAGSAMQGARDWSAIEAIESPLSPGRSAVVITGTSLPEFREFLGYAKSTGRSPDLLLLAGGERYLFRIGPGYSEGSIGPLKSLRWFFATHWIVLLPVLLFGAALLSHQARRFFRRRTRARLALAASLALVPIAARADWPQWDSYQRAFISSDGRVIDHDAGDRSTSEGQAYALFFSLVANDRATFARVLAWTENNLAGADLGATLPSWNWGRRQDGSWGILDRNSASDADLWMSYALLEAGRLWAEPRYTALAHRMLANVVAREVRDLPGLGPMLLPGPDGFVSGRGFRLNPSYLPPQILERFASGHVPGPWAQILRNTRRMLSSFGGAVPDWVLYDPRRGFAVDPIAGAVGSYDAIRVYLWLAMNGDPVPRALLDRDANLPEKIDARTLQAKGAAPIGFYGALLPADPRLAERLPAAQHGGLYGAHPSYYDQNLILFGKGFADGRFRFDNDGALAPAWEKRCPGSGRAC